MPNKTWPLVGDVIRSKRFVNGYHFGGEQKRVVVGASSSTLLVEREMSDGELTEYILKNRQMPASKRLIVDVGNSDDSRSVSDFVVIEVLLQDGRVARKFYDSTEGWRVVAKKLDSGMIWNDSGEEIEFEMTGGFVDNIPPEDIEIVGKMKMKFV